MNEHAFPPGPMTATEILDLAEICHTLADQKLTSWEANFLAGIIRIVASGKVSRLTTAQTASLTGMYFSYAVKEKALLLEKNYSLKPLDRAKKPTTI